jgi:hypothetical protein
MVTAVDTSNPTNYSNYLIYPVFRSLTARMAIVSSYNMSILVLAVSMLDAVMIIGDSFVMSSIFPSRRYCPHCLKAKTRHIPVPLYGGTMFTHL